MVCCAINCGTGDRGDKSGIQRLKFPPDPKMQKVWIEKMKRKGFVVTFFRRGRQAPEQGGRRGPCRRDVRRDPCRRVQQAPEQGGRPGPLGQDVRRDLLQRVRPDPC